MIERQYVISPESRVSLDELQSLVRQLLEQAKTADTSQNDVLAAALSEEAVNVTPDNFSLSIRPVEQNFDLTAGVVFVVLWFGEKVADKAFDLFWERVVLPQIEERWGVDTVVERPESNR